MTVLSFPWTTYAVPPSVISISGVPSSLFAIFPLLSVLTVIVNPVGLVVILLDFSVIPVNVVDGV